METLIYSYHFTVIAIIFITFIATVLSMAKIGPFRNVPPGTTKILVGSLIVELVAAFVGVYKTLPELKFDVSERYRFEIRYSDIVKPWLDKLPPEDKELIDPFIRQGGIGAFQRFTEQVAKYREIKNISRCNTAQGLLTCYERLMTDEQSESIEIFKKTFKECPEGLRRAGELLKVYTRLMGSSKQTGNGHMWASKSGDKMEGIVVYTFPDDNQIPTVLEFTGQEGQEKISENRIEYFLILNFIQRPSALAGGDRYFVRPGANFTVKLSKTDQKGAYKGKLMEFGEIFIQVWEL